MPETQTTQQRINWLRELHRTFAARLELHKAEAAGIELRLRWYDEQISKLRAEQAEEVRLDVRD
jgi:hypothetical protein